MILTTNVKVDVSSANLFNPIILAEDDENSHRLITQLTINDENIFIDKKTTPSQINHVMLNYLRADGTTGTQNGSILNGELYFNLPNEMLELDDIVKCDISLSYPRTIVSHSLSVNNGEVVVSERTQTVHAPLRTALFYIDAQLRVVTQHEGGEL